MWRNPNRWARASWILTRTSFLALAGALALGGCGTTVPGHVNSLEAQKTHPKMWARADTTVDEMRADIQACGRSIPEPKVTGWAMLGAALELGAVAGGGMSPGLVGSSTDSSGDRWALIQGCMADKGYTRQQ
jgi:hypothetical protein